MKKLLFIILVLVTPLIADAQKDVITFRTNDISEGEYNEYTKTWEFGEAKPNSVVGVLNFEKNYFTWIDDVGKKFIIVDSELKEYSDRNVVTYTTVCEGDKVNIGVINYLDENVYDTFVIYQGSYGLQFNIEFIDY